MKNPIKALFQSQKAAKIAVVIGMIAIVLIFLSSVIDFSFLENKNTEKYAEELKVQLLDILSSIDGVGEAKIFLTMDNAGENVYLKNSDTKLKSITPTVRGVVIVCDGGDNATVVARVLSAVTKSLDITSDKVSITKLK